MHCLYLTGNYMYSCTARREVYVQSAYESQEYCNNERHKICPLYSELRSVPEAKKHAELGKNELQ